MEYTQVISPVWANAEHTAINCLVTFTGLGQVAFTATPNDSAAHSRAIFIKASGGLFGPVGAYVAPTVPEAPVPSVVTLRQAKLALISAGLLSSVNSAIASMESPDKEIAEVEWEYATTVERNSPLLTTLAGELGLNDAALDSLFTLAATL